MCAFNIMLLCVVELVINYFFLLQFMLEGKKNTHLFVKTLFTLYFAAPLHTIMVRIFTLSYCVI